MQPVRVPKPSPDAFHKNRRISDLLASQLEHFKHVAKKKSLKIDPQLARDTQTEGGAARYIAAITRALRGRPAGSTVLSIEQGRKGSQRKAGATPEPGVASGIAAAAEAGSATRHTQGPKKPRKGKIAATAKTESRKKSRPEAKVQAAPRSPAKTSTGRTKPKKGRRS